MGLPVHTPRSQILKEREIIKLSIESDQLAGCDASLQRIMHRNINIGANTIAPVKEQTYQRVDKIPECRSAVLHQA